MTRANQHTGTSLQRDDGDVLDMTERRRLELISEHMEAWQRMCLRATERLVDHPTELGDVEHVSPTSWSRARNHPEYNPLLKILAMMAERRSEGASRQEILEFALVPLSFVNTLMSLDGEKIDVPEATMDAIRRISEVQEVTAESIMDGVLTPAEKGRMRDTVRSLEAAARRMRTAVSQTPDQTELWPVRKLGPRT